MTSADANALFEAAFRGCAASLSPLVHVELGVADVQVSEAKGPPEGALAVLTLAGEPEDREWSAVELASPEGEIARLARRMLQDAEPDKERPLSQAEHDAVREALTAMSGAVGEALRRQNPFVSLQALECWRTEDPGGLSFAEGPRLVGTGALVLPEGSPVPLLLRMPRALLEGPRGGGWLGPGNQVGLLGLEEELAASVRSWLEAAHVKVSELDPADADLERAVSGCDAVLLSARGKGVLDLARRLRRSSEGWHIPLVLCMDTPTEERVVRALESGISHVLALPAEEVALLRALKLARSATGR